MTSHCIWLVSTLLFYVVETCLSSLTCADIKLAGTEAVLIDPDQLKALCKSDFDDCASTLGSLSDYTAEHRQALLETAIKVTDDIRHTILFVRDYTAEQTGSAGDSHQGNWPYHTNHTVCVRLHRWTQTGRKYPRLLSSYQTIPDTLYCLWEVKQTGSTIGCSQGSWRYQTHYTSCEKTSQLTLDNYANVQLHLQTQPWIGV